VLRQGDALLPQANEKGVAVPEMPDTTTPKYAISKGWYAIRVLALIITPLALGLTLFTPELGAQSGDLDCADFTTQDEAQAVFDRDPSDPNRLDDDGDGIACETLDGGGGTADTGADNEGTAQTPVDSNGRPLQQNPNTGGPALLPIGAGLIAWSAVGLSLLRRRG
jgi:hypothetical protein